MIRQLGVSITWRCNLKCVHCLQEGHSADSDMSPRTFANVLTAAEQAGVAGIGLTGGEATLHPHFLEFVHLLTERNFAWSLTTNGMVLTKIIKAAVIQPPKRITISFDGHDEESHDAIRGQGSFSKTVRNTYLLGATKIPLQIQATMIRPILNTLDDMLELTKVLGANRLMLAWPIPTPELFERKWFPDYEELAEAKHWYQELSKNDQSRIVFALGDQLLAKSSRDVKPCPFMRGEQFYVNSRGRQALCCQMAGVGTNSSEEVGNIHEGLKEFSSEQSVAPLSAERPMDRFGCMGCMANLKKLPSRLLFPEMRQWVQPVAKNAQLSILPRTSHDSLT